MAQSLWRDGDLKIENNHERGDYREYFPIDLEPHYLTRGTDGEIYSIHPIGLAVILAPVYALAGYKGSVWLLIALGALARGDRVAMDGGDAECAGRGDVCVGGDRALGAVHVQHLHGVSGDRRGAGGDDRVCRDGQGRHRALRHRALDRRRPRDRVVALAEHEVRADVRRPPPRRHFPFP